MPSIIPSNTNLFDFGDTPDTGPGTGPGNYNTLLANNGPRHQIVNELFLGTAVTAEDDAHQNSDATGDDITQGIQDDGVITPLPILSTEATSYSLRAVVINRTDQDAYVYAWVDFSQNGVFSPNEAATVVTVPSAPDAQIITLTFIVPEGMELNPGNTFARLRITTDILPTGIDTLGQDLRSVGPASDGEVEDYILTIGANADLSIDKLSDQPGIVPGQLMTYELLIRNNSPDTAYAAVLYDNVPSVLNNPEYSDNGTDWFTWTGNLALGDMEASEQANVKIRGTVDINATDTITNTASVTSDTLDPDTSNNTATFTRDITPAADVSIVKTASAVRVHPGDVLTYTLQVFNAGPNTAFDTTITDDLPSSLTNTQFSFDGGQTWYQWTGRYNIGSMDMGATATVLIRGAVTPNALGKITNIASIESFTYDPNLNNNSFESSVVAEAWADVAVIKTASHGALNPGNPGEELTFTVTTYNYGPGDSYNVTIGDIAVLALGNLEYSLDGGETWQTDWLEVMNTTGGIVLERFEVDAEFTILFRGTVAEDAKGTFENTAFAGAKDLLTDPDYTNNSSKVHVPITYVADLEITKTASHDIVRLGDVLTYTMVVKNHGPDMAENVVIIESIMPPMDPPVLADLEYTTDGGSTWTPIAEPFVQIELGDLPASAETTVLLKGTVNRENDVLLGLIINLAGLESDTFDPNSDNNGVTVHTPINSSADLSATKRLLSSSPAIAGDMIIFEIVITNHGPDVAENAFILDELPPHILDREYRIDNGNWDPWPPMGAVDVGDLLPGQTHTVNVRGQLAPGISLDAVPNITNLAVATTGFASIGGTPDPVLDNNFSSITIPIATSADVVVRKLVDTPVLPGEYLTYSIEVENYGPSYAYNVLLTDAIPATISNPVYAFKPEGPWQPWTGTLAIANTEYGWLQDGTKVVVYIHGQLGPSVGDDISNTATVVSTIPDLNTDNNRVTLTTETTAEADLGIVKTAPATSYAGEPVIYNIAVTNYGPSTARGACILDATEDAEYSLDGGITWQPWAHRYGLAIGDVPVGATIRLLLRAVPVAPGGMTNYNTATIIATTHDPNPDNNSSIAGVEILHAADIVVTKRAVSNTIAAGDTLEYTLTVVNNGPSEAENVSVLDELPDVLENQEYSLDGVNWLPWDGEYEIGTMAAGASVEIRLHGMVKYDAVDTAIFNRAAAVSTTPDPNPASNWDEVTITADESADIWMSKTANKDDVLPGETIEYQLLVTNDGPSYARNIVFTDELPAELTNVEYSYNGWVWYPWEGSHTVISLAPNDFTALFLRGTVADGVTGSLVNTGRAIAETPDPDLTNNEDTLIIPIAAAADLMVTKEASTEEAKPGDVITYTIIVNNVGPDDAKNVTLADSVPLGLIDADVSVDDGISWKPWNGFYTIGLMTAGASSQVLISGTVADTVVGNMGNTAFVTSSTRDPDFSNNADSANVSIRANEADLSVTKSGPAGSVVPGQQVTYTINVINNGPDVAENAVLTDSIPADLTHSSYSLNGGATWHSWTGSRSLGTLTNRQLLSALIRGTIADGASGNIVNTATVTSDTPDPNCSNNTATDVTPITPVPVDSADLAIMKVACPTIVKPCEEIVYTIHVTNNGPDIAMEITLEDELPSAICDPQYSVDGGSSWHKWIQDWIYLPSMGAGDSTTVLIKGTVKKCTCKPIKNTACVRSSTKDPVWRNNSSTVVTPIDSPPCPPKPISSFPFDVFCPPQKPEFIARGMDKQPCIDIGTNKWWWQV